jgi:hypothetical protein
MRSSATRCPILAISVACTALALSSQGLIARWNGDLLQVTPINLHFLTGKALERLHNGASVPFAFQLSIYSIPRTVQLQRSLASFVISYDLWAERFKVVQLGPSRRAIANLAPGAAEAWCVSQMSLSAVGIPVDRDLLLRLDIRAEDSPPRSPVVSETGFNLSTLIKVFSEMPHSAAQEWNAETVPFRLNSLRQ